MDRRNESADIGKERLVTYSVRAA